LNISFCSRLALGLAPIYIEGENLKLAVKGAIIVMALGTAFMGPVIQAGLRRFTSKKTRATGFNVYYLLMNIGAIVASLIVLTTTAACVAASACVKYTYAVIYKPMPWALLRMWRMK